MLEPLKRPALLLLAGAMLALLPVAGLTGCDTGASDDGPGANTVRQQVITSETIAGLSSGEQLVVDLRTQGIVYGFDFSKAPIDFSRISLINDRGDSMPMDKWLSAVKQSGRDLLTTPTHLFRLSSPLKAGTVSAQSEICILYRIDVYVCDPDGSNCHWEGYEFESCHDIPDWEPLPDPPWEDPEPFPDPPEEEQEP